jgi:hypothetical protein
VEEGEGRRHLTGQQTTVDGPRDECVFDVCVWSWSN